jgi:hypothetical protein
LICSIISGQSKIIIFSGPPDAGIGVIDDSRPIPSHNESVAEKVVLVNALTLSPGSDQPQSLPDKELRPKNQGFWGLAAPYHGLKRPLRKFKAIRAASGSDTEILIDQ